MRARLALALAAFVLVAAATGSTAKAAITVANTNDSGPGSLRQALVDAPPGETISLPAGTYSLTSGPLKVEKTVTITGQGAAETTIRSAGVFRVLETAEGLNLGLNRLTVRDGVAVSPSGSGAGISAANSNLTLNGVTVTSNRASGDGAPGASGGIADGAGIFVVEGTVSLTDSVVSDNRASARGGSESPGGIADGAGIFVIGSLSIVNSTISGNMASAPGGSGSGKAPGGIADGGGVFVISDGSQPVTIRGSTISGNLVEAPAGPEGATGIAEGGGVFVISSERPVSVENTTIVSNVSRSSTPGGIISGGGMFLIANGPGADVLAATISGNRTETPVPTGTGGNLFGSGSVRVGNSIVAGGAGSPGSENCAGGGIVSLGFNLDSLNQCGFAAAGDQVNANPLLGPLQSNGGPTQTLLPAGNSPVVDQGRSFVLTADQRQLTRPVDLASAPNSSVLGTDGADIGAVELQPPPAQQLSNAFKFGKVTKNRKKGRARIQVILPQPSAGVLTLTGKAVQKQTLTVKGESRVSLSIVGKKKVRKALRKRGTRKVKFDVTYTPTGTPAATKSRTVRLVKKKKKTPTR